MRTLMVLMSVVVAGVVGKPASDWWKSLSAADGQFVLTPDRSLEYGVRDYSIEYVRPYNTGHAPLVKKAAGVGGTGQFHYGVSSEEALYYSIQQGSTHGDRVRALTDYLNAKVLDLSDEHLVRHVLSSRPSTKAAGAGTGSRPVYYVNDSGELYYLPSAASRSSPHGSQATVSGTGVQVARK